MTLDARERESYWESTLHFELIPGKTFGTQPWFIILCQLLYLAVLYYLTVYMEKRQPLKIQKLAALHKFE